MMLGYDFNGEEIFKHVDVGVTFEGAHETLLDFGAGVVGVVQDAELRVSALAVQVELTVFLAVEINAPLEQLVDLFGSAFHHLLHGSTVTEPVAGNHSVFYVLVEVVDFEICH